MKIKAVVRNMAPQWALNFYHRLWAVVANIVCGLPSQKMVVIGVTGTQGKTTTANMIGHILNELGEKCGIISTATIKVGDKEWLNDLKMTMPGRFKLQRYLQQMVKVGCKYTVVETSSEGINQWRHIGISYDAAVFTNLSPEHIESHGSYVNYRTAKLKLWKKLMWSKPKVIAGVSVPRVSVVNADDKEADLFLSMPADKKIAFSLQSKKKSSAQINLLVEDILTDALKSSFVINGVRFNLPIGGKFNIYNAVASVSTVFGLGFNLSSMAKGIGNFSGVPGRLEFVNAGQSFSVIIDYAHTPESLEAVYNTITTQKQNKKIIAVLGSCGGGRDKVKRPVLGELAGRFADEVIVTNEDPYDEDPQAIMSAVAQGAQAAGKEINKDLFIVPDRRLAINRAVGAAQAGDVVIITGKGCEQWLMISNGKISWDDRQVAREEIEKILK